MKKLAAPVFALLAAAGIAASIYLVFFQAPLQFGLNEDGKLNGSSLFFNQKIFYFHTAHAMLLIGAVVMAGLCSIVFLVSRNPKWDDVASASVEVAVVFGFIALVSGSIWAKAAWDVWWNWEPRLALTLLLWLILVGYVLVRRFAGPSADRIAAGMAWSASRSSTRWSARTRTRPPEATAWSRRWARGCAARSGCPSRAFCAGTSRW